MLLKNDGNTLPLSPALKSIAVIGERQRRRGALGQLQRHAGGASSRNRGRAARGESAPCPRRAACWADLTPIPSSAVPVAGGRSTALGVYPLATSRARRSSQAPTRGWTSTGRTRAHAQRLTSRALARSPPGTPRRTRSACAALSCRMLLDGMPLAQGRSDHDGDDHGCRDAARGACLPDPSPDGAREVRRHRTAPLADSGGPWRRAGGGGRRRAVGRCRRARARLERSARERGVVAAGRGLRWRRPHDARACRRTSRRPRGGRRRCQGQAGRARAGNGSALAVNWADKTFPPSSRPGTRGRPADRRRRRPLRQGEPRGPAAGHLLPLARPASALRGLRG